jgi:NADH dehydrogenase FAD-containing subunit
MVEPRRARGGTLVLGGGFAGSYVARLLGPRGATIVSLENFMLFTPLLPEAASGTLEPRHVVVPLRVMCPHAELLLGRLTDLDEQKAIVETDVGTFEVGYERAVLALGSVSRVLPIPGLHDHGLGFKDLADAIHLRNHVLRQLEAAVAEKDRSRAEAHLTFVFVGAGYAGVEALAELADSSGTRSATTPSYPGTKPVGSSSTRRRRSSRRSRRGSATTPLRSSRAAESKSVQARRSSRYGRLASSSPAASGSQRTRSCGRPA